MSCKSARCPPVLALALFAALAALAASSVMAAPAPAPLEEVEDAGIGYPTVAAALAGVAAQPGVARTVEDEWTHFEDEAAGVFWSFTPPGHPAHPAVVKRAVVEEKGAVQLRMSVACEAEKAPCDELVRWFQAHNEGLAGRQ